MPLEASLMPGILREGTRRKGGIGFHRWKQWRSVAVKSHHWSAEPGFQLRTSESRIFALKALGIPWVGVLGYKEENLLS